VAVIAVLASGCAQRIVEPEMPRRPDVARAAPRPAPRPATPPPTAAPRPGFVIASPDGARDEIAAELARRTGFTLASSASAPPSARGSLAFYAEIRAGSRPESASRIDITTAGVDESLAGRLRTLYELIRDAHLRGYPGAPRVDVRLEPADVRAAAADAASRATRTLRLELPRVARTDAREPYLAILADFLTQAATLPAGR
jgi:hypothetical protein